MRILIANHDRGGINTIASVFPAFQKDGHEVAFVIFKKNADRLHDFPYIPKERIFIVDEFPLSVAEQFLRDGCYQLVIGSLDEAAGVPDDRPAWGTVSKNALAAAKRMDIPGIGYLDAPYRPDDIVQGCLKNQDDMYFPPDVIATQTPASFFQVRRMRPDLHVILSGSPLFETLIERLDNYKASPPLAATLAKKFADAYGLDLNRPIIVYCTSELAHSFRHPDVEMMERIVENSSGQPKSDAQSQLLFMLENANITARKIYGYIDSDISDMINEAVSMLEEGKTVQRVLRAHPKEAPSDIRKWASDKYALIREGCKITAEEYIDFAALASLGLIPEQNINLTNIFANSGMALELFLVSQGRAKIVTDPPLPATQSTEFLKKNELIPDVHTIEGLAALLMAETGAGKETSFSRSPEAIATESIFTDQKNVQRLVRLAANVVKDKWR